MTIQEIYEKFYSLKTSSDKLIFLDELKTLTKTKLSILTLTFLLLKKKL